MFQYPAPAWGATAAAESCRTRHQRFNPRAAWGATLATLETLTGKDKFNPRARVGRDSRSCPAMSRSGFNPRARVGRDRRPSSAALGQRLVSIHAPAWGATN